MKKGFYYPAAFLLLLSTANASELQDVHVQKITGKGNIHEFQPEVSPEKNCDRVLFTDPDLVASKYQFVLVKGTAQITRNKNTVVVCMESDSAIFEAKLSGGTVFHYAIQGKHMENGVAVQTEEPSAPAPRYARWGELPGFASFRIMFGPTWQHYENHYDPSFTGLQSVWSGFQTRIMAEGRLPVIFLGPAILHATFTLDFLNSNLSVRSQPILTYQRRIAGNRDHDWMLGLGANGIFMSGTQPYGIQSSVSPVLEVEYNTRNSFGVSAYYSPFLGRTIELSSAEYNVIVSYPVKIFKHTTRLALQYQTLNISSAVSTQDVAFSNYGFAALIGFNFGENQ